MKLTPPDGITRTHAEHAAKVVAGYAARTGCGKRDLAELLRAVGLLPDPDARTGAQLALDRCSPYGGRTP